MVTAGRLPDEMAGRVVRLVFLVAGLVFLVYGLVQAAGTTRRISASTAAVGLVPAAKDPSAEAAHPMVQFSTAQGQLVRYRQNGYSARRGQAQVTVLYDPADPQGTAIIRSFSTLWLPAVMALGLGGSALLLSLTSFILTGRVR